MWKIFAHQDIWWGCLLLVCFAAALGNIWSIPIIVVALILLSTHTYADFKVDKDNIKPKLNVELALEAFEEAWRRYPSARDALTFYIGASGINRQEPTPEQIAWAEEIIRKREESLKD